MQKTSVSDNKTSQVIAITSGKGGVGKTSLTINLGLALARMGKKVCLFDADSNLANINIMLRLMPDYTLEHVLSPLEALRDVRSKLVVGGRLVLCVPIDDWRTQKLFDPRDVNHHLYTWTPLLLGNLLTEANYEVERVWIYTHAWPPSNWQRLDARLPTPVFDIICRLTALRYRRRQLMALARKR